MPCGSSFQYIAFMTASGQSLSTAFPFCWLAEPKNLSIMSYDKMYLLQSQETSRQMCLNLKIIRTFFFLVRGTHFLSSIGHSFADVGFSVDSLDFYFPQCFYSDERAMKFIQLERLYHEQLLANLSAIQEQWGKYRLTWNLGNQQECNN